MTDKENIIVDFSNFKLTEQEEQNLKELQKELKDNFIKLKAAAEILGEENTKIFDNKVLDYLTEKKVEIFKIGTTEIFIATAAIMAKKKIKTDNQDLKQALPIIKQAVKEFYKPIENNSCNINAEFLKQQLMPMLHGKAIDTLALMSGNNSKTKDDSVIYDINDVELEIQNATKLKSSKFGVSTHKLLCYAISLFTQQNHTGHKQRKIYNSEINIPLKDYIQACSNKEITENMIKDARKKINKDLKLLSSSQISFSEKVKGKQKDLIYVNFFDLCGISKGYIRIKFTQTISEYLIQLPITQYAAALLKIDERNNNAYSIGLKLTEHYNLDNNIVQKTNNKLKVETILNYTNLPSYDNVLENKKDWRERIKAPFENSLKELRKKGVITEFEYTANKGRKLTNIEADFKTYNEWKNAYVEFKMSNITNTNRLDNRTDEQKQTSKKGKKSK